MPFSHFSKVAKGTTLEDILQKQEIQIQRNCKMIEFSILTTLTIDHAQFGILCSDLSVPQAFYQEYTQQCCANEDGIWKCIIVTEALFKEGIILYTGQLQYPLYAGIWNQ